MRRVLPWILLCTLLAAPCAVGQDAVPVSARVDARTVALVLARHEEPALAAWEPSRRQPSRHLPAPALPPDLPDSGSLSFGFIIEECETEPPIHVGPLRRCWDCLVDETCHNGWRFRRDLRHLYSGENLCYLGVAMAVAAPLAFSSIDQDVSDWYQTHMRSPRGDEWARAGYYLGQHKYTIPIYLGVMATGRYWQDTAAGGLAYTWSNRTIRAMAVGAPAVGVLQYGLGANRPGEGDSAWHPFADRNAVAGHGFVGALPFLAAASMTDRPVLKTVFFAGSLWAPWARLNDDAHFLSQCILGWSIAYLSVRSVTQTDLGERWIHLMPIEEANGVGMGLYIRY